MRNTVAWILAAGLGANGLFMLFAPEAWYHLIPTVPFTGPFNPHFVRDIGCAYLVCGLAMAWTAQDPVRGAAAGLLAAIFQSLHAALHLWDFAAGRSEFLHVLEDLPTVFLVPVLMLWIAWPRETHKA
jgi:hypothetical protein